MISQETLEMYRRMTPGQRLAPTLQAIQESTPYLFLGSPEVVSQRFERIRQENDLGNRRMLERLAAAEQANARS